MIILTLILASLVGLALGLLGGGGSILSLPILVYIAGIPPSSAIPMELFVVGVTSLAALIPHAMEGNVRWRTGLTFGTASMVGAYIGGVFAANLDRRSLLGLFALLMSVSALVMLRGKAKRSPGAGHRVSAAPGSLPAAAKPNPSGIKKALIVSLEGFVVGGLTGLVGAGGGFMIVPTLVVLGGLSMRAAVGTSVMIMAMKSFAGALGHLSHADIPWALTFGFAAIAVVTSFFGARLAGRVPQEQLRRAFGYFVLLMAGLMASQEFGLLASLGQRPYVAASAALALGVCVYWIARELLRKRVTPRAES